MSDLWGGEKKYGGGGILGLGLGACFGGRLGLIRQRGEPNAGNCSGQTEERQGKQGKTEGPDAKTGA